jgi:serine/threonine protein kinase
MNPPLASARIDSGLDLVERAVLSFEQARQRQGEVRLDQYWPDHCRSEGINPNDSLAILVELIKADLRHRFENGESPTVASYLEQFPELCRTDNRVVSLIYEEYCLAEEGGHAPDVESFCGRYPRWKGSLISQLQYHRVLSQAAGVRPPAPRFPNVGGCFEEFQLVSLLGRGGTSRVFLARDISLGGKQVVLKVSLDRGDEPKLHGPLDHPHIVAANSVAFQPDKRLRGLSMPYHPGLPLDVVISRLDKVARRQAIELWHVLVDGSAKSLISCADSQKETLLAAEMRRAGPRGDGWEGFPVRGTFAEGAAWLAMILARALHYAHGMEVFHRDVKPGNVLLTLRRGPQLFDFNLAESPHSAHRAQEAIHGGTLPYMAPEQIEAFLNPELWDQVSARADVYSLGLVLRELLTGQTPDLPDEKLTPARAMLQVLDRRPLLETRVRRINSKVPHALEAIVAKCLAVSPDGRYRDAHALAEDLERFLSHQPLLHAANPSTRERLSNWGRRRRWILISATANLILLGILGILVRKPIMSQFLPRVESVRAFNAGVELVDQEKPGSAIRALEPLLGDYPDHPLVRAYLAFAFDLQRRTEEASDQLTKAVSASNGVRKLLDWGADHPKFAVHLASLARSAINDADDKRQADVVYEDDEEVYFEARRKFVDTAKHALDIVERLGGGSLTPQSLLAKVEEFYGDYGSAFNRLTQAIERAKNDSGTLDPVEDNVTLDDLFTCHALRCRIAVRWVAGSRFSGGFSKPDDALDFLKSVEEQDLKFCNRWLTYRFSDLLEKRVKKYDFLESKMRLRLARGEIEIDLGMLREAGSDLQSAKEAMREMRDAARDCGLPIPTMEKTNKRLTEALSRVGSQETRPQLEVDSSDLRVKDASKS